MNVLGVKVDNFSRQEMLDKISDFLSEDKFHQIATVNPEFILEAQKDEEFRNILNSCDLNIADGMGIKLAFWRLGKKLKYRMAGIDLMREILKITNEKKLKIFLAAKSGGLSNFEETKNAILKIYPDLEIEGINMNCHSERLAKNPSISKQDFLFNRSGSFVPLSGTQDDIKIRADVVFANFGIPFQEKFLNSQKDGKIKLAVGVGGSFDYLTGKLKRAPKWMQFFGVEWLWRLILQPKRIKRIWNAVIIFPIKLIIKSK
jgi:N-acetylglucosaminyldiphosphoundecaprenol N-acetyl-beta-D-mannosaminyltransferase